MPSEPLTETDLDSLTKLLEQFGSRQAMNLEEIDGFLAALVCCPDEVPKAEYLPQIWGDQMINEDSFAAQPVCGDILALIDRHKESVRHTLQSGDVFLPLLLADRTGGYPANDWASGFMRGMNLRRAEWSSLLNDDDQGGSLVPILALANEHAPDPDMRPYKQAMSDDQRERLIIGAAAGVMNIYRYFRRQHEAVDLQFEDPTYRRFAPKKGRNEPCPCGSGKKFKHCCGKITLH